MWRPQVEAFREEFHILVPDLPEQGRSTDAGPFTMLSAAEQVIELIGSRAASVVHVVGLSEGAQVALQLLALEPRLATTAILSSALVRPITGARWASSPIVLGLTYTTSIAWLRGWDWWVRTNMRSAAGVPDAYFGEFREGFRTLSKAGFVDLMRANQMFRLPDGLDAVATRVLAVCGRREYAVMRQSACDIAAAIPGSRACEVVHEGGRTVAQEHNWNMTAPALFNAMVRAFTSERPLPGALVQAGCD
jgi:pimeloyl-ACP methyl ester carboxylesterase